MIGYPSGQDGAILPARDFSLGPARSKIIFWSFIPHHKSFIDQACSVKMAGYWPRSFFFVFMELRQYLPILTEQAWSITHISCSRCTMRTKYPKSKLVRAVSEKKIENALIHICTFALSSKPQIW